MPWEGCTESNCFDFNGKEKILKLKEETMTLELDVMIVGLAIGGRLILLIKHICNFHLTILH